MDGAESGIGEVTALHRVEAVLTNTPQRGMIEFGVESLERVYEGVGVIK